MWSQREICPRAGGWGHRYWGCGDGVWQNFLSKRRVGGHRYWGVEWWNDSRVYVRRK